MRHDCGFQLQRPGAVKYRGVWHALMVIYQEEGFRGYLKGNGTNIIRIFPYSAVQFAAYEQLKKVSMSNEGTNCSACRFPHLRMMITKRVVRWALLSSLTQLHICHVNRY